MWDTAILVPFICYNGSDVLGTGVIVWSTATTAHNNLHTNVKLL